MRKYTKEEVSRMVDEYLNSSKSDKKSKKQAKETSFNEKNVETILKRFQEEEFEDDDIFGYYTSTNNDINQNNLFDSLQLFLHKKKVVKDDYIIKNSNIKDIEKDIADRQIKIDNNSISSFILNIANETNLKKLDTNLVIYGKNFKNVGHYDVENIKKMKEEKLEAFVIYLIENDILKLSFFTKPTLYVKIQLLFYNYMFENGLKIKFKRIYDIAMQVIIISNDGLESFKFKIAMRGLKYF